MVRFIVTEADAPALDAVGGPAVLGEALTEAVEKWGLAEVLRRIARGA